MSENLTLNHATDRPVKVEIAGGLVSVTLADGRIISNPLDWHPWLRDASREVQARYELRAFSVGWPDLDEGLDIEGMLRGIHSKLRPDRVAAQGS